MPQKNIDTNSTILIHKADSLKLVNDSLKLKLGTLQTKANDDRIIKYINAFGSNWIFFLIILLTILVLVCWKGIKRFFEAVTKVKGGLGNVNLELLRESNSIVISDGQNGSKAIDAETADKANEEPIDEISTSRQKFMFDVYSLLDKGEKDEAIKVFEDIQNNQTDSLKKENNKIVLEFYKHLNGFSDSIDALNKIILETRDREIKVKANSYIARCLVFSQNHERAIEVFLESLKDAKENNLTDLASEIVIAMGDAFYKGGKWELYIELLLGELRGDIDDEYRIRIFKKASEIYYKSDRILESVAMLIKANELVSNDVNILFDIAFRMSNLEFNEIAMQTYSLSNDFRSNQASVINNLAVAYSNLGFKNKSTELYIKSHELGNSLASSNLAFRYISAGFIKDATEILDVAKSAKEVDQNVWKALDAINESKKSETTLIEEAFKRASLTKSFLAHYSNAVISSEENAIATSIFNPIGNYLVENIEDDVLKLEFEDTILTIRFSFKSRYGTCVANYSNKPNKPHNSDSYSGLYAYVNGVLKILLKYTYYQTRPEILLFELKGTVIPDSGYTNT